MKVSKEHGANHTLLVLALLLLMEAVLVSGCVYKPDFKFPLDTPIADDPLVKSVIPEFPYSMTWSVDPGQDKIGIGLDPKAGAIPFWHGEFWDLVTDGEAGASPFFKKAAQMRFTMLAPDYTKICGDDTWIAADSATVPCDLSKIRPYYGQGLSAHIDYVYQEPTGPIFHSHGQISHVA